MVVIGVVVVVVAVAAFVVSLVAFSLVVHDDQHWHVSNGGEYKCNVTAIWSVVSILPTLWYPKLSVMYDNLESSLSAWYVRSAIHFSSVLYRTSRIPPCTTCNQHPSQGWSCIGDSCAGFQHNSNKVYVLWSVAIKFLVYGFDASNNAYFIHASFGNSDRLINERTREREREREKDDDDDEEEDI